jgi:hypothetical protein
LGFGKQLFFPKVHPDGWETVLSCRGEPMTKTELPRVDPETIATAEAARERIKILRDTARGSEDDWAQAMRREAIQVENRLAYLTALMFVAFDDNREARLYGVSAEVQTMVCSWDATFYIRRNPTEDEGGNELSYALERTSQFFVKLVLGAECTFGQMTDNGLYARNTTQVFASDDLEAALRWVRQRNLLHASAAGL